MPPYYVSDGARGSGACSTQTEVDDCDGDTFFFDWVEVPGPGQDSERGRLLSWLRQNPEQNADGMNVSAWPLLKLTWDYAGGGSVSHVNAHDVWESVGDLFDMSEAQRAVRRGAVRVDRVRSAHRARLITGGIRQMHRMRVARRRRDARREREKAHTYRARGSPFTEKGTHASRAQEPPRVAPRLQK